MAVTASAPARPNDPAAEYDARRERFLAAHLELESRANRLSAARLIVFLLAVTVLGLGMAGVVSGRFALPIAIALGIAFAALVRVHGRVRRASDHHAMLVRVNELSKARVGREWDKLPTPPEIAVAEDHPYAADLALFGRASIWQLLPDVSPAPGRDVLAGWLLAPADPATVRARQEAVAELTPRIDLRDDLNAFALQLHGIPRGILRAAARLPESVAWLDRERWLVPLARVLTVLSVLGWGLIIFRVIPYQWAWPMIVVLGMVWGSRAQRLRQTFSAADTLATALPWFADLIDRLEAEQYTAPLLQRLKGALYGPGHHAGKSLRELRRILQRAEVRHSPMLHIPLQVLFLWDVHVVNALSHWCKAHGSDIGSWLEALGDIEALSALGGLQHANPGWCLPMLREPRTSEDVRIVARALGHPLLARDVMVPNDLTIGPPGTFVLVTGSNMSGKSTLLRAAGVNTVLAQAGAPVCAHSFELPPLRVQTSIRIQDSLADGVSLFMAELRRLRQVVDAAEEPPPAPPVLYLLDEMLQGTNSAERHLAARAVLARLVRSRAIGLVTTHDVALASAPELSAVAVPVYFDESAHAGTDAPLSFDYRLRPGIVPGGNAMRLLSLVGLAPSAGSR